MAPTIEEALNNGIDAHKAGQIEEANKYYTAILNSYPNHPDANHNKGVLMASSGKMQEALHLFKNALEANSGVVQFWKSYIETLIKLNRNEEAKAILAEAKNHGAHGEGIEELERWLKLQTLVVINKPSIEKSYSPTLKNLKLDKALRLAKMKAREGSLIEAQVIYQDILSKFPKNKKALIGIKNLSTPKLSKVETISNPPGHVVKTLIQFNARGKFQQTNDDALALLRSYPNSIILHNLIGEANHGLGDLKGAVKSYKTAIALKPDYFEAYYNMGNTLSILGNQEEAIVAYKEAISINPSYVEAHNNLGKAFQIHGNLDDAISAYQAAISIEPDYMAAYYNLSGILTNVMFREHNPTTQNTIKIILDKKTVVRPSDVAVAALSLLKLDPIIKEFICESSQKGLSCKFEEIASNLSNVPLLLKLISICPIADLELEAGLTSIRSNILQAISGNSKTLNILHFQSALALHCFTNEYIYTLTAGDRIFLEKLEELVNQSFSVGKQPSSQSILCLASFKSLSEYEWSNLVEITEDLEEVFTRQVIEPNKEKKIKHEIKILDEITDGVSSKVRNQYERNPYPRWVNLGLDPEAVSIKDVVDHYKLKLNKSAINRINAPNILIAGCGTGQHSIGTAKRFKNSNILAVDLSLSSLAYAKRKTKEFGIKNVKYMQADILNLGKLNKKFDIIESVGVLHHMNDPMAGWKVLTSLVKAGGLMRIGLYSDISRTPIVNFRKNINPLNSTINDTEILSIREKIILSDQKIHQQIKSWRDFYSLSELRDLLFHAQEHCFTIPQIKDCLSRLGLDFCGFVAPPHITNAFLEKNNQSALYDLDKWEIFEKFNPQIFSTMYQFWCQKIA